MVNIEKTTFTNNKNLIAIIIVCCIIVIAVIMLVTRQTTNPSTNSGSPTPTPLTAEQKQQLQKQADEDFAKWDKQISTDYPWLNKLPLQTDTYYVYFDINRKQFYGFLYPKTSQQTSDIQLTQIKSGIINQLKTLNVPIDTYPFVWQVNPKK